jgi:hypothetical protein
VLLTSDDLCRARQTLKVSLKAQNGRRLRPHGRRGPLPLGTPACPGHGGGKGR